MNSEHILSAPVTFVKRGLGRLLMPSASDRTSRTCSQEPSVPPLDDLNAAIRDAAHEFSRARLASEEPGGAFLSLVYALCYWHSLSGSTQQRRSTSRSQTEAGSGPLVRFLLCLCEHPEGLSEDLLTIHEDALKVLLNLTLSDDVDGLALDSFTFTVDFCAKLGAAWRLERSMRWSPFPWSTRSREEGYSPPATSFDHHAPDLENRQRDCMPAVQDDLFYFPDLPWLGGRHDGHCRSTSLSAYVWLRLSSSAFTISSRQGCLALWQSALTLGVLEAMTAMRIPESLLLSPQPDGSRILSSKKVSAAVSSWLFGSSVTSGRKAILQRVKHAHSTVIWALSAIDEASMHADTGILRDTGLDSHVLDHILCSMWTLLSMLYHLTSTLCERHSIPKVEVWLPAAGKSVYRTYERMLVAKGWCPYTMELLGLTVEPMVYASNTSPFFRTSADEHARCVRGPVGRGRCIAYNINTAEYKTQHAPTCSTPSTCPFLSPPLARVLDLLSSGQIPVIVYDEAASALEVRSAAGGPYMAISHVWADGLGSTTEGGLPTCQVARIAAYARHTVPGGAFWVDSLCVPEVKEMRKRAIRLMAETYRGADAVVVFEAGLRVLCTSALPLKELFFRISTSSWMQRVWTLQEALLARDLYFEFADGLYPIGRLGGAYEASLKSTVATPLGPISRDIDMQLFLDASGPALLRMLGRASGTLSFMDVVYLLQNRTTSKPEDQTVAIAGLLGVDVGKLLAESEIEARMRAFLLDVGNLPAEIVFASTAGTNLEFPGFRWAPRALVSLQPRSIRRQSGMARCTSGGLTTEQKFGLVALPTAVHVGGAETYPDAVYVSISSKKAVYILAGLRTLVGDRALTFNGIVTAPGHLESLKEGSSMISAVAVLLATPYGSRSLAQHQPVVCEYRFVVYMSEVTDLYSSSIADQTVPGDSSSSPAIEGRFSMVRITMT